MSATVDRLFAVLPRRIDGNVTAEGCQAFLSLVAKLLLQDVNQDVAELLARHEWMRLTASLPEPSMSAELFHQLVRELAVCVACYARDIGASTAGSADTVASRVDPRASAAHPSLAATTHRAQNEGINAAVPRIVAGVCHCEEVLTTAPVAGRPATSSSTLRPLRLRSWDDVSLDLGLCVPPDWLRARRATVLSFLSPLGLAAHGVDPQLVESPDSAAPGSPLVNPHSLVSLLALAAAETAATSAAGAADHSPATSSGADDREAQHLLTLPARCGSLSLLRQYLHVPWPSAGPAATAGASTHSSATSAPAGPLRLPEGGCDCSAHRIAAGSSAGDAAVQAGAATQPFLHAKSSLEHADAFALPEGDLFTYAADERARPSGLLLSCTHPSLAQRRTTLGLQLAHAGGLRFLSPASLLQACAAAYLADLSAAEARATAARAAASAAAAAKRAARADRAAARAVKGAADGSAGGSEPRGDKGGADDADDADGKTAGGDGSDEEDTDAALLGGGAVSESDDASATAADFLQLTPFTAIGRQVVQCLSAWLQAQRERQQREGAARQQQRRSSLGSAGSARTPSHRGSVAGGGMVSGGLHGPASASQMAYLDLPWSAMTALESAGALSAAENASAAASLQGCPASDALLLASVPRSLVEAAMCAALVDAFLCGASYALDGWLTDAASYSALSACLQAVGSDAAAAAEVIEQAMCRLFLPTNTYAPPALPGSAEAGEGASGGGGGTGRGAGSGASAGVSFGGGSDTGRTAPGSGGSLGSARLKGRVRFSEKTQTKLFSTAEAPDADGGGAGGKAETRSAKEKVTAAAEGSAAAPGGDADADGEGDTNAPVPFDAVADALATARLQHKTTQRLWHSRQKRALLQAALVRLRRLAELRCELTRTLLLPQHAVVVDSPLLELQLQAPQGRDGGGDSMQLAGAPARAGPTAHHSSYAAALMASAVDGHAQHSHSAAGAAAGAKGPSLLVGAALLRDAPLLDLPQLWLAEGSGGGAVGAAAVVGGGAAAGGDADEAADGEAEETVQLRRRAAGVATAPFLRPSTAVDLLVSAPGAVALEATSEEDEGEEAAGAGAAGASASSTGGTGGAGAAAAVSKGGLSAGAPSLPVRMPAPVAAGRLFLPVASSLPHLVACAPLARPHPLPSLAAVGLTPASVSAAGAAGAPSAPLLSGDAAACALPPQVLFAPVFRGSGKPIATHRRVVTCNGAQPLDDTLQALLLQLADGSAPPLCSHPLLAPRPPAPRWLRLPSPLQEAGDAAAAGGSDDGGGESSGSAVTDAQRWAHLLGRSTGDGEAEEGEGGASGSARSRIVSVVVGEVTAIRTRKAQQQQRRASVVAAEMATAATAGGATDSEGGPDAPRLQGSLAAPERLSIPPATPSHGTEQETPSGRDHSDVAEAETKQQEEEGAGSAAAAEDAEADGSDSGVAGPGGTSRRGSVTFAAAAPGGQPTKGAARLSALSLWHVSYSVTWRVKRYILPAYSLSDRLSAAHPSVLGAAQRGLQAKSLATGGEGVDDEAADAESEADAEAGGGDGDEGEDGDDPVLAPGVVNGLRRKGRGAADPHRRLRRLVAASDAATQALLRSLEQAGAAGGSGDPLDAALAAASLAHAAGLSEPAGRSRVRLSPYRGYCPVSLHDEGLLLRGRPSLAAEYRGCVFAFADACKLQTFLLNPIPYLQTPPTLPPSATFAAILPAEGTGRGEVARDVLQSFAAERGLPLVDVPRVLRRLVSAALADEAAAALSVAPAASLPTAGRSADDSVAASSGSAARVGPLRTLSGSAAGDDAASTLDLETAAAPAVDVAAALARLEAAAAAAAQPKSPGKSARGASPAPAAAAPAASASAPMSARPDDAVDAAVAAAFETAGLEAALAGALAPLRASAATLGATVLRELRGVTSVTQSAGAAAVTPGAGSASARGGEAGATSPRKAGGGGGGGGVLLPETIARVVQWELARLRAMQLLPSPHAAGEPPGPKQQQQQHAVDSSLGLSVPLGLDSLPHGEVADALLQQRRDDVAFVTSAAEALRSQLAASLPAASAAAGAKPSSGAASARGGPASLQSQLAKLPALARERLRELLAARHRAQQRQAEQSRQRAAAADDPASAAAALVTLAGVGSPAAGASASAAGAGGSSGGAAASQGGGHSLEELGRHRDMSGLWRAAAGSAEGARAGRWLSLGRALLPHRGLEHHTHTLRLHHVIDGHAAAAAVQSFSSPLAALLMPRPVRGGHSGGAAGLVAAAVDGTAAAESADKANQPAALSKSSLVSHGASHQHAHLPAAVAKEAFLLAARSLCGLDLVSGDVCMGAPCEELGGRGGSAESAADAGGASEAAAEGEAEGGASRDPAAAGAAAERRAFAGQLTAPALHPLGSHWLRSLRLQGLHAPHELVEDGLASLAAEMAAQPAALAAAAISAASGAGSARIAGPSIDALAAPLQLDACVQLIGPVGLLGQDVALASSRGFRGVHSAAGTHAHGKADAATTATAWRAGSNAGATGYVLVGVPPSLAVWRALLARGILPQTVLSLEPAASAAASPELVSTGLDGTLGAGLSPLDPTPSLASLHARWSGLAAAGASAAAGFSALLPLSIPAGWGAGSGAAGLSRRSMRVLAALLQQFGCCLRRVRLPAPLASHALDAGAASAAALFATAAVPASALLPSSRPLLRLGSGDSISAVRAQVGLQRSRARLRGGSSTRAGGEAAEGEEGPAGAEVEGGADGEADGDEAHDEDEAAEGEDDAAAELGGASLALPSRASGLVRLPLPASSADLLAAVLQCADPFAPSADDCGLQLPDDSALTALADVAASVASGPGGFAEESDDLSAEADADADAEAEGGDDADEEAAAEAAVAPFGRYCPVAAADCAALTPGNRRCSVRLQGRLFLCSSSQAAHALRLHPGRYLPLTAASHGATAAAAQPGHGMALSTAATGLARTGLNSGPQPPVIRTVLVTAPAGSGAVEAARAAAVALASHTPHAPLGVVDCAAVVAAASAEFSAAGKRVPRGVSVAALRAAIVGAALPTPAGGRTRQAGCILVSNGWMPDERTLQLLAAAHVLPGAVLSLRCDATELHRHRKRAAIQAGAAAAGAPTGPRDASDIDSHSTGEGHETVEEDDGLDRAAPAESGEGSDEAAAAAAAAEEEHEQAAIAAAEADAADVAGLAASFQDLGVASAGDALQWSGLQNTARLAAKLVPRVEPFALPEHPLEAQQVVAPQSAVATAVPLEASGGLSGPASIGGLGGHADAAAAGSAPEAYGRPTLTPARIIPLSLGLSLVALGACRLSKFAGVCPVALLEARQQAAAAATASASRNASESLEAPGGNAQASRQPAAPLTLTAAGPSPQAFPYAHAEARAREGTATGGSEEEGEGSSPAEGDDDGAGSVGEEAFPQAEDEEDGGAAAVGRTASAGGGADGGGTGASPALQGFGEADYTPPVVAVQLGACLYLLSSQRAALAFARAPLRYVTQPPLERAVPLCLAVVGPPGCGVSDLAAEIAASAGLLHITAALAIAYVCERVGAYLPLSARVRSLLAEGGCLSDDVVLQCIAATALSAEATSRGCVIDGWPSSAGEASTLAACGVLPSRVVWVGCPSDVTLLAVQAAGQRLAMTHATSPHRAAGAVLAPSLPVVDGAGGISTNGWPGGDNGEADDETAAAGEQTADDGGSAAAPGLPRWTEEAELQGFANVPARAWRAMMGGSGKRSGQLGSAASMPASASTTTATEATVFAAELAGFRASETQLMGWYRSRFGNVLCVDATAQYSGGRVRCGVSARQTRQLIAGLAAVAAEASYAASALAAGWAAPLAASLPALGTLASPHSADSSADASALTAALASVLQVSSPFGATCPVTWVLQREAVSPLAAAGTGIDSLAATSVAFRGRAYATAGSLETRELCARPARYLQGLAPPEAAVRAERVSPVAALMPLPSRLPGSAPAAGSTTDQVAARGLCAVCWRSAHTQLVPTQLQTALASRAGLRHLAARVSSGPKISTPGGAPDGASAHVWRCCCEEHLTALLRMPGYYTVGLQGRLPLRPPLKLDSVLLQAGAPLTAGAAALRQLPAGSAAAQEGADFTAGLLSQLHGAAAASADFRAYMQASVFPPLSAGLAALERCRGLLYHPQAASIRASALNFLSLWLQAHDPYARPHLRARSRKALAAFLGECGLEVSDVVVAPGPGEAGAAGSPSPGSASALLNPAQVGGRLAPAADAVSGVGRGRQLDPLQQQAPVLSGASARARPGLGDGEGFVESAGSVASSTASPARKQLPPVSAAPGAR